MHRKTKALLLICLLFPALFFSRTMPAAQSTVDALRKEISDLAREKEQLQKQINEVKKEKTETFNQKTTIDRRIGVLSTEIAKTGELIAALSARIKEQEGQLTLQNQRLDARRATLKSRIRAAYENGETHYLSVLLKTESFFDMMTQAEFLSSIVAYDRRIIAETNAAIAQIKTIKAGLEADKKEQEGLSAALTETQNELTAQSKESAALMQQLEGQQSDLLAAYNKAQAAEDALNASLKAELAKQSAGTAYVGGVFITPLPGYTRISSAYGPRKHPVTGQTGSFHRGIDLPAPLGTPIVAAGGGTIMKAEYNTAYGNYIVIDHGGGTATLYAHMSKFNIKKGAKVSQGDTIGFVGTTGWSTGYHLHFEVIVNGQNKQPLDYVTLR